MGLMVNGVWQEDDRRFPTADGQFRRPQTSFRNWVTPHGEPGPAGQGGFAAAPGRYHLYVSLACPWAHRTLIMRRLKRLEDVIGVSVVDPYMGPHGWAFSAADGSVTAGSTRDEINGRQYLYEIYAKAQSDFSGRVTVPVLWDKERQTIVNNESAENIRMLNGAFDQWGDRSVDFYPEDMRGEIDRLNPIVYDNVNNGVYRCGFAATQEAYDTAFDALFRTLGEIEALLGSRRYVAGDRITEADWRLFTTLVRFDAVYYVHFKCNLHLISSYPNLWNYTRELYQVPGVAGTVNLAQIKRHYYTSHPEINPSGIIARGPVIDFAAPHDRAGRFKQQVAISGA